MFNYFLITSGILANAYVCLVSKNCYFAAGILGATGTLISLFFYIIDLRNAQLIYWGEDQLRKYEKEFLFSQNPEGLNDKGRQSSDGILLRDLNDRKNKWIKHKICLGVIEWLIIIMFLLAEFNAMIISYSVVQ